MAPRLTLEEKIAQMDAEAEKLRFELEERKRLLEEADKVRGNFASNHLEVISQFLEDARVKYSPVDGFLKYPEGEENPISTDLNRLLDSFDPWLETYKTLLPKDEKGKPLVYCPAEKKAKSYFNNFIDEENEKILLGLRSKMRYDPSALGVAEKDAEKVLHEKVKEGMRLLFLLDRDDPEDKELELNTIMWKHMMRCIKNRVFHSSSIYELLFSLYSRGGGWFKTRTVKALLPEPMYLRDVNATALTDRREYIAMSKDCYVLFIDEFGTEKSDTTENSKNELSKAVELVRKMVTDEHTIFRNMATHSSTKLVKTATIITAGNQPFYEIMQDSSGGRKFWTFRADTPCFRGSEYALSHPEHKVMMNAWIAQLSSLYKLMPDIDRVGYFHESMPRWSDLVSLQEYRCKKTTIDTFFKEEGIKVVEKKEYPLYSRAIRISELTKQINTWLRKKHVSYTWSDFQVQNRVTGAGYNIHQRAGVPYIQIMLEEDVLRYEKETGERVEGFQLREEERKQELREEF